MKKQLQRILCLLVTLLILVNTLGLTALAQELSDEPFPAQAAETVEEALPEYCCGMEEHLHTEACRELICGLTEEPLLTCEAEEHTHTDCCWNHLHTEACMIAVCGLEETPGHTHTEECFGLICELEETEGHSHTEECFGLICELEETEGHSHTEECMALGCGLEPALVCTLQEHTHTEECFTAHTHTGECYGDALLCGLEEHTHTESCLGEAALTEDIPDPVAAAAQLLTDIDSLQTMKDNRANHDSIESYRSYVEEMLALREQAQAAVDLLTQEQKALLDSELLAKLAPLGNVFNHFTTTITPGEDGYQFQMIFPKNRAYEISTHLNANKDHPMPIIAVDTEKVTGEWSPEGEYVFAESDYEVLYCCELKQPGKDGVHYRRINLEDSDYYDEDSAAHIRAIVTSAYPYVTLDEMRDALESNGYEYADQLSRSDIITAVQFAIWHFSNKDYEYVEGMDRYGCTTDITRLSYARSYHDYTNELWDWWKPGRNTQIFDPEAEIRVNSLVDYLIDLDKVTANEEDLVISSIDIVEADPVKETDGLYNIVVEVALNSSCIDENDEVNITVSSDVETRTVAVTDGVKNYRVALKATRSQDVVAEVKGTQIVPNGAYLYYPQGGKDVSQVMVGVAAGETLVHAAASVSFEEMILGQQPLSVSLHKTDLNGVALQGAEFALSYVGPDGKAEFLETVTPVGEDAAVVISGLFPHVSYLLTETAAPEGYSPLAIPIRFHLTETGELVFEKPIPQGVSAEGAAITVANRLLEETDYTQLTVKKVWRGDNANTRPQSVTVQLLCDGTAYGEPVILSEENGWTHTWLNLDAAYRWTVEETEVPEGYRTSQSVKDTVVTIYNTKKTSKKPGGGSGGGGSTAPTVIIEDTPVPLGALPANPDTGDHSRILLALITAEAACVTCLVCTVRMMRKTEEEQE